MTTTGRRLRLPPLRFRLRTRISPSSRNRQMPPRRRGRRDLHVDIENNSSGRNTTSNRVSSVEMKLTRANLPRLGSAEEQPVSYWSIASPRPALPSWSSKLEANLPKSSRTDLQPRINRSWVSWRRNNLCTWWLSC